MKTKINLSKSIAICLSAFLIMYFITGTVSQSVFAQPNPQGKLDDLKNLDPAIQKSIEDSKIISKLPVPAAKKSGPMVIVLNSFIIKLKLPEGGTESLKTTKGAVMDKTIKDVTRDIKGKGGNVVGALKQFGILHVKLGDTKAPLEKLTLTHDAANALTSESNGSAISDKLAKTIKFKKLLEANPAVEAVSYDVILQLQQQQIPTGVNRIDSDRGPAKSGDGSGTIRADIAILDSGVQANHPDLNVGRCLSFVNNPYTIDPVTGDVGPVVPLNNCTDNVGHGTHVAGIAAALDNNVGVVGAAPGARIFALKVCDTDGCPTSDILEGLDYVASHYYEIDVVNLSLGMERPNWLVRWFVATDEIEEAITRLVNTYGVVVVVAAGNDHINAKDYTPARTPAAITVSAMADRNGRCGGGQIEDDIFASFSNYGSVVDLAAPGVAIDSTLPGSRYGALSGTSMAAPHVTGAVALYLSLHPSATPAQVDQYLKSSGTKAPTLLQQNTGLSCDGNGRGYFSSRLDVDNIREPLLYTGWGAPICPRDCEATTAR